MDALPFHMCILKFYICLIFILILYLYFFIFIYIKILYLKYLLAFDINKIIRLINFKISQCIIETIFSRKHILLFLTYILTNY